MGALISGVATNLNNHVLYIENYNITKSQAIKFEHIIDIKKTDPITYANMYCTLNYVLSSANDKICKYHNDVSKYWSDVDVIVQILYIHDDKSGSNIAISHKSRIEYRGEQFMDVVLNTNEPSGFILSPSSLINEYKVEIPPHYMFGNINFRIVGKEHVVDVKHINYHTYIGRSFSIL